MKKGLLDWAGACGADLICLQETRAFDEQIDRESIERDGWHLEIFPAEKPGYAGTGILSRTPGKDFRFGSGDAESDREGRIVSGEWCGVRVFSVYAPSGGSGTQRQDFKMRWLSRFRAFADAESARAASIFCGDFNICHKEIDIHNPEGLRGTSGFLPMERDWFSGWLSTGMIDSYREYNPEQVQYSWWSMRGRARERNLGWRIDYAILCPRVSLLMKRAWIDAQVACSDHCPTLVEIR